MTTSRDERALKSASVSDCESSSSSFATAQRLIEMLENTRYFDNVNRFHFQFVENNAEYSLKST